MGGDLRQAPAGKAPTLLIAALRDPIGANLDRIQIVKGWLDARGEAQEKVYDVAWSGDRKAGADGKLPPVGNTVDVPNASWTNTIGATELITVWKDPAFDAVDAGLLLRPRAGDPDAALDRLRSQTLQYQHAAGGADGDAGTRLHLADLVHAVKRLPKAPAPYALVLGAALLALSSASASRACGYHSEVSFARGS